MYLVQCSLPCLFPIPISVHCSIFGSNSTSVTLQNRSAVVACQNRFQNAPILAQNCTSVCLASHAVERYMYRTLHCCTFSGNYGVILVQEEIPSRNFVASMQLLYSFLRYTLSIPAMPQAWVTVCIDYQTLNFVVPR